MPKRGRRWEKTPFGGPLDELVDVVVEAYPWTLATVGTEQERTTDPGC